MNHCDLLDDYLAHDLSVDGERQFVEHLAECMACREAVDAERHMAHVLTQATSQLEPTPSSLAIKIYRRQLWSRTRYFGAIAASIICVVVLLSWLTRSTLGPSSIVAKVTEPAAVVERPPVRVTFRNDTNITAVPMASDEPNVTVYWVFPNRTKRDHQ